MPKPRSPKEIKQFLGLTGYYRKFVPRFSDMARPLIKLLAHDCEFEWTKQCDISFQDAEGHIVFSTNTEVP